MKRYIKAMTYKRKDAQAHLNHDARPLIEHLVKYYCFPEGTRKYWTDEIYGFLNEVDILKTTKDLPDKDFIFESLWTLNWGHRFHALYVKAIEKCEGNPVHSEEETKQFVIAYLDWLSEKLADIGDVFKEEVEEELKKLDIDI